MNAGEKRTRKTLNTDTFYAVLPINLDRKDTRISI